MEHADTVYVKSDNLLNDVQQIIETIYMLFQSFFKEFPNIFQSVSGKYEIENLHSLNVNSGNSILYSHHTELPPWVLTIT